MKVLAIVRALNEEAAVASVVRDVRAALPRADVLVVDDGSRDATGAAARAAGAEVLRIPRNLGMCAAVQRGYRYALAAGYDAAVQLDGDGQHRAVDAAALLAAVGDLGADVVVGSRFLHPGSPGDRSTPARRVGNRVLSRSLTALSGRRVTDATSGLRACGPRGIAVFARQYPRGEVESEALLVAWRHGLVVAEVPVQMRPRRAGRSTITSRRSAYYGWRAAMGLVSLAAGRVPAMQREAV
ncbi:MAG: glycosyltransferase family 2 protein [Thermoleophilia bacterium]